MQVLSEIFEVESAATSCGLTLPMSKLTRLTTEFIRDTETELLFNHSSRVYCFGASYGIKIGLSFDPELLYVAAMFHDLGLMPKFGSTDHRFEVDSANAAADFLRSQGLSRLEIDEVWTAIALHTTPEIPQHMSPVISLVTAGVEMDVLGLTYESFTDAERTGIVSVFPRTKHFKEDIIEAFYQGIKHKPGTTFGNVKADVLADKNPTYQRLNFCSIIRNSRWAS